MNHLFFHKPSGEKKETEKRRDKNLCFYSPKVYENKVVRDVDKETPIYVEQGEIQTYFDKRNERGRRKRKTKALSDSVINILTIHNQIIKGISKEARRPEIDNILLSIEETKKSLKDEDIIKRVKAKKTLSSLRSRLEDLENDFVYGWYLLVSEGMIRKYKENMRSKERTFFGCEKKEDDIENTNLVISYLSIAQIFVPSVSNCIIMMKRGLVCHGCGGKDFIEKDTVYICSNCYAEMEIFDKKPTYKDTNRINLSSRYKYSRKQHFLDAKACFEAKQNKIIPEHIMDIIYKEMEFHGIEKRDLKKIQLYTFLVDNKLNDYYDDVNLIHYKITGIQPPDLSSYDNQLLSYHNKIDNAFSQLKNTKRTNSLNVYYKLYRLLRLVGYKISKEDFFLKAFNDKQKDNEETWEELCDIANIPNV